ncbi:glycosyltransferase family 2 protein [Candidatus Pacearchaeota archaeon]|nr:glycosyltransferase family 2 protein [Candidatus Pacearchaeota archaeon]
MLNTDIKNELSIIIPAWKADKWINECLKSIYNQTWIKNNFNNSNWEILIGIDCCDQTKYVIENNKNLKVFFFKEHSGPYIIRNTLAYKEAKYSNLLYFDSDDIMENDLLDACFKLNKIFITFQYGQNKDIFLTSRGSSFLKKELLFKYGGYQSWKCASDIDFIKRIKDDNIEYSELTGKNYMIRGRHKKQLTRMKETGLRSPLRTAYHLQTDENLKNKIYYVEPKFNEYTQIFNFKNYMIIIIIPKLKQSLIKLRKFKKNLKNLGIKNYNLIYLDIPNKLNYWQDEYDDNKIKQELINLQIPTILIENLNQYQFPIVYSDLNLEIFNILKLPDQYFDVCFDLKKTNFHIYNYTEKSLRFLKIWEYLCQNIELSYLNYLDRFKLVIDLIENENKLIENKTIINKTQLNIFNKKIIFKKNKNKIKKKQSVAIPMGFPIPDSQKEKNIHKINRIKKPIRIKEG